MSADFFHGDEETALVFADVLKVMRYNVAPLLTGYNDGGYGTTYLFEIFVARRVLLTRMMYVHLGETLRKYITLQRRCIAMIDYIYGDDSIVLSDIYQFVCRHKIDFLLYDEALDYATRCLHIAVYQPVTLTLLARLSRPTRPTLDAWQYESQLSVCCTTKRRRRSISWASSASTRALRRRLRRCCQTAERPEVAGRLPSKHLLSSPQPDPPVCSGAQR